MLTRYRRTWILIAACMLVAPLVVSLVAPHEARRSATELRVLAPRPPLPRDLTQWFLFPPQVNAFLTDHFGLRESLIRAEAVISHYFLDSGNDLVFIGHNYSLFYLGDHLLQSSAGIDVRQDQVAATADLLATIHAVLASRGIKFLVASPPNSATVYPKRLPTWLRSDGRMTEYDLFMAALARRHVPATDLRAPLLLAKHTGKLYWQYDSHWTPRGALAGFNALVVAAGLDDWQIDPAVALGPELERSDGDLARMLDLSGWLHEKGATQPLPFVVSYQQLTQQPFSTFVVITNHPGPTVMVIGDSFTGGPFTPLVIRRAGRFIWMHHDSCGFDWKWIDEFHPDFVWYMPTERLIPCPLGRQPKDMPRITSDSMPMSVYAETTHVVGQ